MKKMSLSTIIIVGFSFIIFNSATAQPGHKLTGGASFPDCEMGNRIKPPRIEISKLLHQAVLDILVELTESKEVILEKKLTHKPLWAVIDEFKVDFETFHLRMKEKENEILQKAVTDETLTQAQADHFKQRLKKLPTPGFPAFNKGMRKPFPPESHDQDLRCEKAEFFKSLREKMFQATIEEIAVLAKQQEETIEKKLKYKPLWAVLDEYSIEFEQLQTVLNGKLRSFIDQAVADNTLTEAQANRIAERMDQPFGHRPKGYPF
ncbi:hypothetical protein KJ966_13250 [bacterium]|nr:hypothetical protein [bacterium]